MKHPGSFEFAQTKGAHEGRCIKCHVDIVRQRRADDPNLCLWCRMGELAKRDEHGLA